MPTALWTDSRFYGPELLQIADSVAREKGLDKEKILEAMEGAIQKAAGVKYGEEHDIRVNIDRKTGGISITKHVAVVENVEDECRQISLEDALEENPEASVGYEFITKLPPIDFGRVAAQTARQIIMQKIYEAEREKQYNDFKDKVGEIVSGVVKRAEFSSVTLDVGRTDAVIRRDQLIPKENFRVGDRVRAYIASVTQEERGAQIFLSRTHPQFLAKLFMQEVPEIYDGVIEIKAVARDPGSRAKVAVYSADPNIDAIGACVGIRGNRVQAITQELRGEKIDIIPWSENPAAFAVNALAPAEVSKVVVDEENHKFEVQAPDAQLSLAIGRRGQNVRLASQLTGWGMSVVSETEALEKQNQEYHAHSQVFMEALDCDEMIAHLLVTEGFATIDDLLSVSADELASIEGFDESIASELLTRAEKYKKKRISEIQKRLKELKVDPKMNNLDISAENLLKLAESNVRKIDDLADLSSDELIDILPDMTNSQANEIIMKAREHWFK